MSENAPAALQTAATDDDSTDSDGQSGYSRHVEPPAQGGEEYDRCEGCGREVLVSLGGRENIPHKEGCPNGGDGR